MVKGCLYPTIKSWRMFTKISESDSKYAQTCLLELEFELTKLGKDGSIHKKAHRKKLLFFLGSRLCLA